MATPFLQLNGFCARGVDEVAWDAKEAVTVSGGWVLEAQLFSNKSLVVRFEISSRNLAGLVEGLERAQIWLDPESKQRVQQSGEARNQSRDLELLGTLQVTLTCGGPDVKRVVPSVPG